MKKCFIVLWCLVFMNVKAQNWMPFTNIGTVYFLDSQSLVKGYRLDAILNNEYIGHKGRFLMDSIKLKAKPYSANWFANRLKFENNVLKVNFSFADRYEVLSHSDLADSNFINFPIYDNIGSVVHDYDNFRTFTLGPIVYERIFNGQLDSVKYIYYTTANYSDTVKLSKNNGVVKWLDKAERINTPPPVTNAMMYDFAIGDIKQLQEHPGPPKIETWVVKNINTAGDTRIIDYKIYKETSVLKYDSVLKTDYLLWTLDSNDFNSTIEDLNALFDSTMYKFGNLRMVDEIESTLPTLLYLYRDEIVLKQQISGYAWVEIEPGFYTFPFETIYYTQFYSSCLGKTNYYYNAKDVGGSEWWTSVIYSKSKCGTVGTKHFNLFAKNIEKEHLEVVSDGANGFRITGLGDCNTLAVYDLSGKRILSEHGSYFDMAGNHAGVYVVLVNTVDGKWFSTKFYFAN